MDAATGSMTTAVLDRTVPSARTRDRRVFYTGLSAAMFLIVLVGFGPTYYLKTVYGTPALAPLYHVHGAFFTTWMLLMILQRKLRPVEVVS